MQPGMSGGEGRDENVDVRLDGCGFRNLIIDDFQHLFVDHTDGVDVDIILVEELVKLAGT